VWVCNRFTELRREALKGKEILVEDEKQNNGQLLAIISTDLLDTIMEQFTITPEWVQDEDGSFTVTASEIDTIGYGATKEMAAEVLALAAKDYAEVYSSDLPFYLSSIVNRSSHFPYLRRIARCNGDIAKIKRVLEV
jgi:hypothetical protein